MSSASLFHALKPVCVSVAKQPTVANLQIAKSTLSCLSCDAIYDAAMLEYISFPFKLTLKKKLRQKEEILCLDCLSEVFRHAKPELFTEEVLAWALNYFSVYFLRADNNTKSDPLASNKKCEESVIAITTMLSELLKRITLQTLSPLLSETNIPLLGHIVSVLLDLIENERSLDINLLALNCLNLMFVSHDNSKISDDRDSSLMEFDQIKRDLGSTLAAFFPGIAIAFSRVLTSQKHLKVLQKCLLTFSALICVLLYDISLPSASDKLFEITKKDTECTEKSNETKRTLKVDSRKPEATKMSKPDATRNSLKVDCTETWLRQLAEKLDTIFGTVLPTLSSHAHHAVHLTVLTFVERVLPHVMMSLQCSAPKFIAVLASLSCDAHKGVSERADGVMRIANKQFVEKGSRAMESTLDEHWYAEVLALPRVVNGVSTEQTKLTKLNVVKGYLKFYGKRLKRLLVSPTYLEKFIISLLQILELDDSDIRLVQEQTTMNTMSLEFTGDNLPNRLYQKQFKSFRSQQIFESIEDILHLAATYGDIALIVDNLLEKLQTTNYRTQAVLIINQVLSCQEYTVEIQSLIDLLADTYTQEEWWNAPISNVLNTTVIGLDELIEPTSLDTIHGNIQLTCALLEGIAVFAKLARENLDLMRLLYCVLEKVGSKNAAISNSGLTTLYEMAAHCGEYRDVAELILRNADYLVNCVALSLRNYHRETQACRVLSVVCQHADTPLLAVALDTADDVFDTLDRYGEQVAGDMLDVLVQMCEAVKRCHTDCNSAEDEKVTSKPTLDVLNIKSKDVSAADFFLQYSSTYLTARGEINENETDVKTNDVKDEVIPEDGTLDEKRELPKEFQVVVASLEKCVHFLPCEDTWVKLKALELVASGVRALRSIENELLPLVHKMWSPLLCRFKERGDEMILVRTLEAVSITVECSGDFMRKRISQEFLPTAAQFLREHRNTLVHSQYTRLNKVLMKLMSFLANIVPTLDVTRKLFCQLLHHVTHYTCNQHVTVSQAATSCIERFRCYKPDIVWLYEKLKKERKYENSSTITTTNNSKDPLLKSVQNLSIHLNIVK